MTASLFQRLLRRPFAVACGTLVIATLAGCVSPLSFDSPSAVLKESRLTREVTRQAENDPFPTPKQAGIR